MKISRPNLFVSIVVAVSMGVLCWLVIAPNSRNVENAGSGKKFKNELLDAIAKAERIEIVEHSWHYDFITNEGELIENPPGFEYKRVELLSDQKNGFRKAMEQMYDAPKTEFSLCAFSPHHSIELCGKNGSKIIIRVCFSCGDTEWEGKQIVPPREFQGVFRNFIESLGFQAFRDWQQLAKAHKDD